MSCCTRFLACDFSIWRASDSVEACFKVATLEWHGVPHEWLERIQGFSSLESGLEVLDSPCFNAQVLSINTAPIDRGEKLLNYCTLPSLQTYVLLAQDTIRAEVYSRLTGDAWRYEVLEGDAILEIPCAGLKLPVSSLYKGVL